MTALTPRRKWAAAVKGPGFPTDLRVIGRTLLALADLMTPTGELHRWRDELVRTTGLPPRTLDRHLQRAVDAGWLVREVPAGKRRQAVYLATIPEDAGPGSVRHSWRTDDEFCAPHTRIQNERSVRHLVANSIQSASRGERGALDRTDDGDQHRADEDLQTVVDGLMRETRERAARCHVVRLRDLPADRWPRQVYCPAAGCGWPVSIGTADDDEQCARCRRPTKSDAERGELLALLPAADYPGAGVLKPAEDPTDVAAGLVAAVLDPAHRSGQDLAAVAAAQLLAGEPRERVGQALAELTRKPHWQPRWLPAFVTALPASAGTGVPAWEQLTDYSPRF